jgi:hypothetical protein
MDQNKFPLTVQTIDKVLQSISYQMKQQIRENGSVRSGTLLNSVTPISSPIPQGVKAGIEMIYYGKFVNDGTVKMRPKPFIENSIKAVMETIGMEDIEEAYGTDLENNITPLFKQ